VLNDELFLPSSYRVQDHSAYFDDTAGLSSGIVYQPEVYPVAEYLLAATGRSRLVDVGCGIGRKLSQASAPLKLGIDFGANLSYCRTTYPDRAEWCEIDLGGEIPGDLAKRIGPEDVVICSDVVEHLRDPRALLGFLRTCFQRGALIITSTPDRIRVRGADHLGPPPNLAHVREWALDEYRALLIQSGLPPLFLGLTHNNDRDRLLRTVISLHEPRLQARFAAARSRPLAILSCFNEEDVIAEVIEHWAAQGCDIHALDNWSNDATWARLQEAAQRFGDHLVVERFPTAQPTRASWREILLRKEEIALSHPGRWIVHTDADELRTSPFGGFNLADSMHAVGCAGWNRIDFTVLNHRPVNDRPYLPGSLLRALPFFEFGNKPGHFLQRKAWLQGEHRVTLAESGGHVAASPDARDCPYHFVLHHFPLRSVAHGRRKINRERHGRWSEQELSMGWHGHYDELAGDAPLVWDAARLNHCDPDWWTRHGLRVLCGLPRDGSDG
jgi:hypothetical protein